MTQEEVVKYMNKTYDAINLIECSDEFCSCDAEDDNYLVEIKNRDASYKNVLIEGLKFQKNINKAIENNKEFIYLSEVDNIMRTWNINKLLDENYDFGWEHRLMPETTTFSKKQKIWKIVGYLNQLDSKII